MRSPKPAVLAVSLSLLLFWSVVAPTVAQGGGITVTADYELFGATQLNGGGHVTWDLTGDAAQALRTDIVNLFDGYPEIPRGFLFHGYVTYGNHDGVIEQPEGQAYTDRLENVLEGSYPSYQTGGSQVGYFLIDRATLLEKDIVGGFNRSTSGIVGTSATSTGDLRIAFLFNGATNTSDVTMPLATQAYAQALFRVFSIEADQAGAWPFPVVSNTGNATVGWHSLFYDGAHPAVLWAGNSTTCRPSVANCTYDNAAAIATVSSMDPALGAIGIPLDLRFATSASITFNYTGSVHDLGDSLQVQAAPSAAILNWTTLPGGMFSMPQNIVNGTWRPVTLNLSAFLGQEVRLRLDFTSDGAGNATGFFLSNLAIHAPSTYTGSVLESDAHYLIGAISFSNFQVPSGSPTLVRTPGGEVLFYSGAFGSAGSPDVVRFEGFDVMENPQVLFAIMVIACYFIARLQDSAYDAFREAHPRVFRPALHKAKWLHHVGKVAIAFLILFYFVPTAFFVIGLRVYFNGPAYFFAALTLTLALGFGTRAYYQQQLEAAPPPAGPEAVAEDEEAELAPEEIPEEAEEEPETVAHCTHCLRPIHADEATYPCSCGAVYHMSCASGLMRCSNCRKPIAGMGVVGEKRSVSMRCASCGEIQTVPEGADPRTLTCASCGGSLRSLDAGKRYLLVASNPAIAFHWLSDLTKGGKPALVFTQAAPDRLRLEFGLKGAQFLQVSGQGPGAVDAKKLDPNGLKAILPLAREGRGGVILYDGLDQMIGASSMGDVVRFLRKANDMAFVHQITVVGRVAPGLLAEAEIERLGAEFDETMDLSARL